MKSEWTLTGNVYSKSHMVSRKYSLVEWMTKETNLTNGGGEANRSVKMRIKVEVCVKGRGTSGVV